MRAADRGWRRVQDPTPVVAAIAAVCPSDLVRVRADAPTIIVMDSLRLATDREGRAHPATRVTAVWTTYTAWVKLWRVRCVRHINDLGASVDPPALLEVGWTDSLGLPFFCRGLVERHVRGFSH